MVISEEVVSLPVNADMFKCCLVAVEGTVGASERATLAQRNADASVPSDGASRGHEGKSEGNERGFAEHGDDLGKLVAFGRRRCDEAKEAGENLLRFESRR